MEKFKVAINGAIDWCAAWYVSMATNYNWIPSIVFIAIAFVLGAIVF